MGLPDPIVKISKNDEAITMEAIDAVTYEKCYFPNYEIGKPLVNPRKTKLVKIHERWHTINEYFNYLIFTEGYMKIPQSK